VQHNIPAAACTEERQAADTLESAREARETLADNQRAVLAAITAEREGQAALDQYSNAGGGIAGAHDGIMRRCWL